MSFTLSRFVGRYQNEVVQRLKPHTTAPVLREEDLAHLPEAVRNYVRYAGAVGKPRIHNFRAVSTGSIKLSVGGAWMEMSSRQYNFFDDPARLYYIRSSLFGIPVDGLHSYTGTQATMKINAAYVIPVADASGGKMNQSENVTMFNDLCLFAPAELIGTNISWEPVDPVTARARYTHNGITISAVLHFNKDGELENFVSDDRYLSKDGKTFTPYRWSTPVKDYQDFDGRKVPVYGEASWQMLEGPFTYARFTLKEIEYNCSEFR
jgi:hypothetical protein